MSANLSNDNAVMHQNDSGHENATVYFDAFLPEENGGTALPELTPELAALHAAHKGMHPVLFTVIAALHEIL
jgi:hypothetical protein